MFLAAFGRESRTVAILHRAGWGTTKWTRIEETAIKGRVYDEGADFFTLVKLDDAPPPLWVPRTGIWGDFKRLKVQGVAAVLAERVRQAGGRTREETAEELSARIAREQKANAERLAFLDSEDGVRAGNAAARDLMTEVKRIGKNIGAGVTEEREIVLLWRDGFSVNKRGTAEHAYGQFDLDVDPADGLGSLKDMQRKEYWRSRRARVYNCAHPDSQNGNLG